jgi:uncharacterized protein (DUF1697 family)
MGDVRTYLQSGNVVVSSDTAPDELARASRELISERFGLDVPVIVRTAEELERVLDHDPFAAVATEPKRYWVSFLDAELPADRLERLAGLAAGGERVTAEGRELYAWLPDGVGRSKLGTAMAAPAKGVTATARNWLTVQALHAMAAGQQ